MTRIRGLILLLVVCILCGCGPAKPTNSESAAPAIKPLIKRIAERLRIMPQVAAWKIQQGTPINDPTREAALLDKIATMAADHKIPPERARAFYLAQIDAAKKLQQALKDGTMPMPPEASKPMPLTAIRVQLDQMNEPILAALAQFDTIPADANRDFWLEKIANEWLPETLADAATKEAAIGVLRAKMGQ